MQHQQMVSCIYLFMCTSIRWLQSWFEHIGKETSAMFNTHLQSDISQRNAPITILCIYHLWLVDIESVTFFVTYRHWTSDIDQWKATSTKVYTYQLGSYLIGDDSVVFHASTRYYRRIEGSIIEGIEESNMVCAHLKSDVRQRSVKKSSQARTHNPWHLYMSWLEQEL